MTEWQLRTPIGFLIYRRPETTARVFAEIARAKPPRLLVVADGPRPGSSEDIERCQAARAIVEQGIDWPCEVLTNYAETNLGCRRRVSSGLNWVFETVKEAIVLEDDCLPHPSFFRFCQAMLDRYRADERVMHISGDNFQFGRWRGKASYYFSRYSHVWGWASWSRAWQHYDVDLKPWATEERETLLRDLESRAERVFWRETWDRVYKGEVDTWDYQWAFACMSRQAVSVVPNVNLVSNIGFGTAATHTNGQHSTVANLPTDDLEFPLIHPHDVVRDPEADAQTSRLFFRSPGIMDQAFGLLSHLSETIRDRARFF